MHVSASTRASLSLVTSLNVKEPPGPYLQGIQKRTEAQPVMHAHPLASLKSEARLPAGPSAALVSLPSPLGSRPCLGAGLYQSLHKPGLKPQVLTLLKCLITFHNSSLPKTLKGLLFLLPSPLSFNVRKGRQGGGWI